MSRTRVAVLVDLQRNAAAGGHVKYWERLAFACAQAQPSVDLTVYFSGSGEDEILAPHVRFRFLPPVFSSARLRFLPYVPAHTDLAFFHPRLAQELSAFDLIHTTDGCFAFARTAERVARERDIPLVTSFHTDTPAYTEVFTRETVASFLGNTAGGFVDSLFHFSLRQRRSKEARLKTHLANCSAVLALRAEDRKIAGDVLPQSRIKPMRLGADKSIFKPLPDSRAQIRAQYGIPPDALIVLFVGRVDVGKNVPLLLQACEAARKRRVRLHLLVAGLGPLSKNVKGILSTHATLGGLVQPEQLATFYAAADCLAMVSDIEIGGLIGLEALACGCPVLASKKNGVAALYGGAGVMEVESRPAAWAEAFALLARDGAVLASLREAALAFRDKSIADWHTVFQEDFLPVWRDLAPEGRCSANAS